MERFSTCELRDKEVVNMCDGTRLGCPSDFEFSICDGRITALIVPRAGGLFGFCRDAGYAPDSYDDGGLGDAFEWFLDALG